VFNVVCGDRETGPAVVSHPIPKMVSITGSIAAGMAGARAAADG
jgi:betaine-aldehyde dehydrogenase